MCSKKELPKNLSDASSIPNQEVQEQLEYKASGKLKSKIAIITRGDSGIGRSVAALFALEGCEEIAIVYLPQLICKDIGYEKNAIQVIDTVVKKWSRIDVLVNNTSEQLFSLQLNCKGVHVNAVASGPIWTPLVKASYSPEMMEQFGKENLLEVAPCYVFLTNNDSIICLA
ncbi:hypothetical protein C2G38_2115845, partial [Gigaspora rosea]